MAVSQQQVSSEPLRVLVVDDNRVNRRLIQHMLQQLGVTVDLAVNGQEAVEQAQMHSYDLVLMDCQMPVMNGYEATRQIRVLHREARHLPIIAVTAHRLLESREKCLNAGMDEYLTKPLRLATLKKILDTWCRNS